MNNLRGKIDNTLRLSYATTGYSQWKKLGGSIRSTSKSDLPPSTVRIEELRDALVTGALPSTVFEEGLGQMLEERNGPDSLSPPLSKDLSTFLDSITASVTALEPGRE